MVATKNIVFGGIILLIIVFFVLILVSLFSSGGTESFVTTSNGVTTVSVEKATNNNAYLDTGTQQFIDEAYDISTAFSFGGLVDGQSFSGREYTNLQGEVLLRVTPELNPANGVPEGFIVINIEDNDKVMVTLFVDEEWKTVYPRTNMAWGADFENVKPFLYRNKIGTGVYTEKIVDDRSRFNHDFTESSGGIALGTMTENDILQGRKEGITAIRLI